MRFAGPMISGGGSFISFRIVGTGHAVPENIITNEQWSSMVDTSDEWITSRTGIKTRHICMGESLSELSALAARRAMEQAGVTANDIDLILCATLQGDYVTPSLACVVQKYIGATCPAFDVNAACTGFVYALDVAAGYFARGRARRVLVIAAECLSKHLNLEDRSTCVLFGDGAGAVVLTEGDHLLASTLSAAGDEESLIIHGTPSRFPGAKPPRGAQVISMNGQEIYRFAVNAVCRDIEKVLREADIKPQDIHYFLLHQANQRILDAATAKLGVESDRVPSNVGRYGNTSAASIPILLDELHRAGKIQSGDLLTLCAFGGGLTTGAAVIRW